MDSTPCPPLKLPVIPEDITSMVEVVAKREQTNKNCAMTLAPTEMEERPECSLLMWNDKVFFRVEKQALKAGAVEDIDLCADGVYEADACDEDSVSFVGCYVQSSRAKEGAGGETGTAPRDHSSSAQLASSKVGPMPRAHHVQISSPSPSLCALADHKLKQMFGITSEVEIRLPRVACLDMVRSSASQAPPLDYTQPIEEDFLCDADPPHSQGCPQVEAAQPGGDLFINALSVPAVPRPLCSGTTPTRDAPNLGLGTRGRPLGNSSGSPPRSSPQRRTH
ncbi:hypothetical protein NQD34_004836 [Periophthalmus magnuspinnatus]|nr:hypothetical protein NQD34_004836 [Periophthalmus magnuspinnatus]